MSEQDEKLQAARRLVNEKRYDEARALLRTIPDNPTAQRWLQKMEGTASQPGRRTGSAGNRLMLIIILSTLVLTLAVAIYGAFLKPVPTAMARSDIEDIIGPQIEEVTSSLGGIERTVDEKLTLISTEVRSQLDRIDTSVGTGAQRWEYLTVQYNQAGVLGSTTIPLSEFVSSNDPIYDRTLFGDLICADLFSRECAEKFRGLAHYLNLWGNDGWELVSVIDKSTGNTYGIEMIFRRPR